MGDLVCDEEQTATSYIAKRTDGNVLVRGQPNRSERKCAHKFGGFDGRQAIGEAGNWFPKVTTAELSILHSHLL